MSTQATHAVDGRRWRAMTRDEREAWSRREKRPCTCGGEMTSVQCARCDGAGMLDATEDYARCPACGGMGWAWVCGKTDMAT